MKAIDILFNEIDEINSQIKIEEDTDKKVTLALNIRKIVDIFEGLEELRLEVHWPIDRRDYSKCEVPSNTSRNEPAYDCYLFGLSMQTRFHSRDFVGNSFLDRVLNNQRRALCSPLFLFPIIFP